MGFKAEEAVPKLEYDFRPYVKAHGITPEPTSEAQSKFVSRFQNVLDAVRRTQLAKIEAVRQGAKAQTEEERQADLDRYSKMSIAECLEVIEREVADSEVRVEAERLARDLAELIEEVSTGAPTADEIMGLPGRVRSAYFGWFVGQLSDPESWAAGTKPSLAASLNGVSAT